MEEKLQKALVSIALKVCEAKKSPLCDRCIITSLTELLRYFRDNGMLKEALVSGIKSVSVPDGEQMADRFITAVFE